jgi:DNA-binding PadR family transcriptional regulator
MRSANPQNHEQSRERGRWDGPPEHFGFGFGGPRRGRRGGPGRRARRGDVRAAALALLGERPMHGYEMIQELEERTDGVWRPSPGAVYPALQLLEDQGLVTADADAGKRLFSLTDAGREEAAKAGDRKPWDDVTAGIDPTQFKLRDSLGPIAVAARQVALAGTSDQQAAAVEILAETRRKLYAILAEDPADPGTSRSGTS